MRQKYDFSPFNSFSGKLIINGKNVDLHSDEGKLKKIKGLVLDPPMFFYQKGIYNDYTLSFVNNMADNTLITFEVNLKKTVLISHQDSWSKQEIKDMKNKILKDEDFNSKIEANLIIHNVKKKDFIDCYVTRITVSFTPEQISNPDSEILKELENFHNECFLSLMK